MGTKRGAFIVIEGTDGSGKGTQFTLLRERLEQTGYQVDAFDFPQYDQPSSYFVRQYLNGAYGTVDEVGPYTASLFYALDRYHTATKIKQAIAQGKIVLSNRFTGSSMGHQGTKFRNAEERRGYFIWLDNLEFELLRIPRPDVSFILRVPVEISQDLIDQKPPRTYTDKKRDIHESDRNHLQRALSVYDDLTQLFPQDFQRIDCVRGGKLLDRETIRTMLWEKVLPLLPQPGQIEMPLPAARIEDGFLVADPPASADSAREEQELPQTLATNTDEPDNRPAITNPGGEVYAFTAKLEPAVIAAVMASLTRAGGELRTKVLDAFSTAAAKDARILQRSVRAYGHDIAGAFVHQHIVVAKASGLLAAQLQDSRDAQCASPDPRHMQYEQKDGNGLYKYHLPSDLDGDIALTYRQHIDRIFDAYAAMLPRLSAHLQETSGVPVHSRRNDWVAAMRTEARNIAQTVLPVAATMTVGVYASASTFDSLIPRLRASGLPEAQRTGDALVNELRKTIPAFLQQTDTPESGGSETAYRVTTTAALRRLAAEYLPGNHARQTKPVRLLHVSLRNELDVLADMLYEHADMPLHTIQSELAAWPYSRKLAIFEAYIGERLQKRERPGRALERIHYSWDIMCDYAVFRELQQHRIVDAPARQALTPRYGYTIPEPIEAAGLSDEYEACFDTSLALYSKLQQAGYPAAAQYATLRGHRMRFTVTYNAREAFRIHEQGTAPHVNPAVRTLVHQLHEGLSEIHPLIGEAMCFVGHGDDPDLTRRARTRYEQFMQPPQRQQRAA